MPFKALKPQNHTYIPLKQKPFTQSATIIFSFSQKRTRKPPHYFNNPFYIKFMLTDIIENPFFAYFCNMSAISISNAQYTPLAPTTYGVYSQIDDSTPVTATTVPGSLVGAGVGGLSINANFFQVGDSFYAELGGIISAKSNDDIRIIIKSGTTILSDTGFNNLSSITNGVWNLNIQFTIRAIGGPGVAAINTIGKFLDNKTSNQNISGFAFNFLNNTTFDTTILNTLTIEAEWNSADPINSIYSTSFVLSKIF